MRNIKSFTQFLNEGMTNINGSNVDYDIDKKVWSDNYGSDKELAELIVTDLSLKSGNITYTNDTFEVDGTTKSGKKIFCSQDINYIRDEMYKPTITVNGKDMTRQARKKFDEYGWGSDEMELARTDIWGDIVM